MILKGTNWSSNLAVQRQLIFWLPKICTFLSFVIAAIFPSIIAHSMVMAYLFAISVTVAGALTLIFLSKRRFRAMVTLTGLTLQATLLILNFAAIHHAFGVAGMGNQPIRAIGFPTAIYFSVVTWTTLGYGDYVPAPDLQLIAALEAAVGYVYLGLIVGLAANLFGKMPPTPHRTLFEDGADGEHHQG